MEKVICIDISSYRNALTRGAEYEVLETDSNNREIKVKDDADEIAWYPTYCFAKSDADLFSLKSFTIDDQIRNPYLDTIEVTLVLSHSSGEIKRWCYFLTPAYVYKMFNDPTDMPFIAGSHGIFLPVLTEETIKSAIGYLESQNLLLTNSQPLGESDDSESE